jgi:hypothetical protein
VCAVVRAGIPIRCPAQPTSGVVNGKEKSSELAGHVRRLLHVFHYNLLSAECKGKLEEILKNRAELEENSEREEDTDDLNDVEQVH